MEQRPKSLVAEAMVEIVHHRLFDKDRPGVKLLQQAGFQVLFVEANDERGHFKVPVIEVWCDPKFPDAWREPELLEYLAYRASRHGLAALIRYDSHDAQFVVPPALSADRMWVIKPRAKSQGPSHTFADKVSALGHSVRIELSK